MYDSKIKAAHIKWLNDSEWSHKAVEAWHGIQPEMNAIQVGYYTPSSANWSYTVHIASLDGQLWQVVCRFGEVVGGRMVSVKNYTSKDRA